MFEPILRLVQSLTFRFIADSDIAATVTRFSTGLIIAVIIAGFIAISAMFMIWLERKVSAHMQSRFGPMRVGFHGWKQPIADTIKLLAKEDLRPYRADKIIFFLAPFIVFVPAFMAYVVIPFGDGYIAQDLNIGVLYILAITSLVVIGILMAGWSSNNKYSLLGGMRSAAQIVSYEVPLVFSILGVIMLVGSLSMKTIVEAQSNVWFVVLQPLGFLIYLVAAVAEVNRTPFDIPEAESELVAGFHIEYSGMKFALFFLAEYTNMFTISAIATTLFLGGWHGPFLPASLSWVWFFIKTYAIVFLLMWFRWTFPRLRVDQLMNLGWKILLPLSFVNIGITGIIWWLVKGW